MDAAAAAAAAASNETGKAKEEQKLSTASAANLGGNSTRGAQLLEVYALEIQMCTEQRNNRRLKELCRG